MTDQLSHDIATNVGLVERELGVGESFDVIVRRLVLGGRQAALVYIDGLVKDEVMTRVLQVLLSARDRDLGRYPLDAISDYWLAYLEVTATDKLSELVSQVLAGPLALVLDGENRALLLDVRTYPAREPAEPDLERVIRGSRDGFVETLVANTALIRRRVRDPKLRFELLPIGKRSRTDTVIAHISDVAPPGLVATVRQRLQAISIDGLPMAEKTVEEFLVGRRYRWNPFPVIRYTERPDVAAVHLLEGHILVLVDTSPSIIMLPATLFHHLQHAEEYREAPLVGAYLRWVRFVGMLLALIGPPLWVALALRGHALPDWLDWIGPQQPGRVPLPWQFILGDFGLDLLRLALIHTPTALATSLGLIGAVLLGDLAVTVGLLSAEAVLYLAIAALGTFATPSMEFGLAVRLGRLGLLIAVLAGGLIGLVGGGVALVVLWATMRSFGVPYLWPLLPLNWPALWSILVRRPSVEAGMRPGAWGVRDTDRRPSPGDRRRQR